MIIDHDDVKYCLIHELLLGCVVAVIVVAVALYPLFVTSCIELYMSLSLLLLSCINNLFVAFSNVVVIYVEDAMRTPYLTGRVANKTSGVTFGTWCNIF